MSLGHRGHDQLHQLASTTSFPAGGAGRGIPAPRCRRLSRDHALGAEHAVGIPGEQDPDRVDVI